MKSLKIYSEIKSGELFDKMVELYSDDSLKSQFGMLGEFEKGGLIPSLERKISEMEEGEISSPVWTKDGVYILKLIKRKKGEYASIEKVKGQIYLILFEKKKKEKFNEWMKSLWEKSSIKIIQP